MSEDFFSHYLPYTSNTEAPLWFNRWAAIASIGALLGRQYYFKHGHFTINPNIYCMLLGTAGTRKSSSIKLAKKLLKQVGYNTIAADATTKEKFLMDLSGVPSEGDLPSPDDFLNSSINGVSNDTPREVFIMADEANDFFKTNNFEFLSLLGTLWDYEGSYEHRLKNSKSISVNDPTVSILCGNTPTGFSLAFPPEILGQGFFSRILLIHGEPNGKKIAFPKAPDPKETLALVEYLRLIRMNCVGAAELQPAAEQLLEHIYIKDRPLEDPRFATYSTRRFSHLLKLCVIHSAARVSTTITVQDVIHANTVLTHAETLMPKALGEFGKSRNSDISHKIMQLINSADEIVTFKSIWKQVSSDLEKMTDLSTLLQNLASADKIQTVQGGLGFLPKRKVISYDTSSILDYSYLTDEEKDLAK